MTATELQPLRHRKSSAATVRHHRKYLTWRLQQVAPGAHIVRATPVLAAGADGWTCVVLALDEDRQAIRLRACERDGQWISGHQRVTDLLRGAFPQARWDRTQTWHADRPGQLAEYAPPSPARPRGCAVCDRPAPAASAYCGPLCRNLDDPHDDYPEDDCDV